MMAYISLQIPPGAGSRGAILRPLQGLLFLAFLVLALVIGVTASDAASRDDGVAVKANSAVDESSSDTDVAVTEHGEADAQDKEAGSDKPLLAEDEGQLPSNVELKTVSPHNVGKRRSSESSPGSSPGPTGTSTPTADESQTAQKGDKAPSAADEEKEAREREKYREIYGKAAREAAAKAKRLKDAQKSARYAELVGPTMQDKEHEKLQAELAKMPPEQREELIAKRRKEAQEKEDTRLKYDAVVRELKQKLQEREERKAAAARLGRPRSKSV